MKSENNKPSQGPSPWRAWVDFFQDNLARRDEPIPWESGYEVEPGLRWVLIRSLQRFQVGESGEGRHLRRTALREADADYAQALDLFVGEEQEHARLLARLLRGMGADLLSRHWSHLAFTLLRRLGGLRLELLTLLTAEMIGKRYYQALHDGMAHPLFRSIFARLIEDEEGHLAFHTAYLGRAYAALNLWERILLRVAWRAFYRLVCLVVLWDHRAVLAKVGVTRTMFWWDTGLIFDRVASDILRFPSDRPLPVIPGMARCRGAEGPVT